MADIQHKDLPNSQLHEPKHILTATTGDSGKVITPSSMTNGVSQLRYLTIGDITNSGASSWTGWAQYADSDKVSEATALDLTANTRTKLTIDGLGTNTNTAGLPTGVVSFWDSTDNKITPAGLNDAYDIRLSFTAKCASAGEYLEVELDIGGSLGTITHTTIPFLKTVDQNFQVNIPVFSGTTFLAQGGTVWVTASDAAKLWNPQILIIRTHKGS